MAMKVERTKTPQISRDAPPPALRGTQSFVSVMVQVWKRPALLGIEVMWRWTAAIPLLCVGWWAGSQALREVPFDARGLRAMTVLEPTAAASVLTHQLAITVPALWPVARWWVPLAWLTWNAASAWGRTVIWQRLDPQLRANYGIAGLFGLLRSLLLCGAFLLWGWGLFAAVHLTVTAPAAQGAEPNLVLLVALAVALTMLLFTLWSAGSWVLDAAPLFAMWPVSSAGKTRPWSGFRAGLRAAWRARTLRPKLIETNLVMGIIKVALLVLAMVFSASPLPFASVETTGFLAGWWAFVGLLYLVFSDLFQVIRRAAYLRLF